MKYPSNVIVVAVLAILAWAAAPSPAHAWEKARDLSSLCGAKVVLPTMVRGHPSRPEALPGDCRVTVSGGATLRLAGIDAAGDRLAFVLKQGGQLELSAVHLTVRLFDLRGVPRTGGSGGAVRLGGATVISAADGGRIETRGDVSVRATELNFGLGSVALTSELGTVEALDAKLDARNGANLTGRLGVRAIGVSAGGGLRAHAPAGDVLVVDTAAYGLTAYSGLPAERAVVVVDSEAFHPIALDDRTGVPVPAYRTCVSVGNVPPVDCPAGP